MTRRQVRNSISAAGGPGQGVGSLLSTPWSPSITTSPEERRPDQHCLSLSLPQSQASRRARAAHSPPDSLLASSRDGALSSLSFFSCQGARMESESPLVSLLLWAWSRAPDPRGGHKRQKRALRKQGADPGVTNPYSVWGDTVGSAFPPTAVLCPPSGHRLSTSGLC